MDSVVYVLAFVMDLVFKDIESWPHPVRFIGKILNKLEEISRSQKIVSLKMAGMISLAISCGIVSMVVFFLISIPIIGIFFKLYFAYAGLSLGGLIEKGREVLECCKIKDIESARKKLSYLVTRDTHDMDEPMILRSLAETLSENFNDGFVAPFFYLIIGGPVLLWIYKTVSTMDSMWGYKTIKWKELGWSGAKMDDILGYIPARISFLSIFLFYWIRTRDKDILKKIKLAMEDTKKLESPNAGWPMAACAWVFSSFMGGEVIYFDKKKVKPYIGGRGEWNIYKIEELINFLFLCGLLSSTIFITLRSIFS